MCLRVYECRGRWYWRLLDRRDRLVARAQRGYRTFAGAEDDARFVMEGLRNCLEVRRL